MKLLKNINTESFTTINYVSADARSVWEPIIANCSQLVQRLELLSVAEDQRRCAWRTVSNFRIPELTKECLRLGINAYPIENIGSWGQGFTHKTKAPIEGRPTSTYCIITKKIEYAQEYHIAFDKGDHQKQGELLGFPRCCTAFFKKVWPKYFDPVWQCAKNTYGDEFENITEFEHDAQPMTQRANERRLIDIYNSYGCKSLSNPILRYIGLRVGFHIPCSFNCMESIRIANFRLSICKSREEKDLAAMLTALLSMSIEWSVLHGVALIKTPIFYVRTNSMPTIEKYTIRLNGHFMPKESVTGIGFPFREKQNDRSKNTD